MIYGGTNKFESEIISKLKQTFKFGPGDAEVFTYISIELTQRTGFTITIGQKNYINSISEISFIKEQMFQSSDQLDEKERKDFRRAVGQLNWVSGITRPDISFHKCDASTRFKNSTVADALRVNKVIKYLKNTDSFIKIAQFEKNSLRLQLFMDASFNSLPNGSSEAGQIIFLSDSRNSCCPVYWNLSKIKRVVRSTLAAETLTSDGCNVSFYVNKVLSELIHTDRH